MRPGARGRGLLLSNSSDGGAASSQEGPSREEAAAVSVRPAGRHREGGVRADGARHRGGARLGGARSHGRRGALTPLCCVQLQEQLPQKVLPLVSSGMKSQAYLSQNTLVEMTLGWVSVATVTRAS